MSNNVLLHRLDNISIKALSQLCLSLQESVVLETVRAEPNEDHYSFYLLKPFKQFTLSNNQLVEQDNIKQSTTMHQGKAIWSMLKNILQSYQLPPIELDGRILPFVGGVAGYVGYEALQYIDNCPIHPGEAQSVPDLVLNVYDVAIIYDHMLQQAMIVSTGLPYQGTEQKKHAARRLEEIMAYLEEVKVHNPQAVDLNWQAQYTKAEYENMVANTVAKIHAGDIFQANIALNFHAERALDIDAIDIYQSLKDLNPAPFAGAMKGKGYELFSASPEMFLYTDAQRQLITRPIKGTAARDLNDHHKDGAIGLELYNSVKNRAENIMIVDLLRNDISKVAALNTVKVTALHELRSYQTVHHLVSEVQGELAKNYDVVDAFMALFPGGSITGAPKRRSIELIHQYEKTRRGPFCGTMGFFSFDGQCRFNILIRTLFGNGELLKAYAGCGVVADSDPTLEYEEALTKAASILVGAGS